MLNIAFTKFMGLWQKVKNYYKPPQWILHEGVKLYETTVSFVIDTKPNEN